MLLPLLLRKSTGFMFSDLFLGFESSQVPNILSYFLEQGCGCYAVPSRIKALISPSQQEWWVLMAAVVFTLLKHFFMFPSRGHSDPVTGPHEGTTAPHFSSGKFCRSIPAPEPLWDGPRLLLHRITVQFPPLIHLVPSLFYKCCSWGCYPVNFCTQIHTSGSSASDKTVWSPWLRITNQSKNLQASFWQWFKDGRHGSERMQVSPSWLSGPGNAVDRNIGEASQPLLCGEDQPLMSSLHGFTLWPGLITFLSLCFAWNSSTMGWG